MGELVFVVPASFDGCAVSDFLRRGKGVSYRLMKTLKRMDPPWGLLRDEMLIRTIDTVREGDRIVLRWPEQEAASVPLAAQVPVLYEDASLVVFNKPWNMPCHPVRKHQDDTLGNVFAARCAAQGQTLPFRPVNRLDKDTTGIVVAAKDPYAASKLAGNVEKEYLAILCGCPDEKSGTIDAPIRRVDPVHILREVSPDGQRAVTHYEIIAEKGGYSLARLWLETGRTHQIRVHMSYLGYPLAGDVWYGGDSRIIDRQALHCFRCRFLHPISGEQIELTAPLDDTFVQALRQSGIQKPDGI